MLHKKRTVPIVKGLGETMIQKETRLLRIGVLGAGPVSQAAHFDACRRARNVELYAICDVAEDLGTRMATIHEPRVPYFNYHQMLAEPPGEAGLLRQAERF